MTAEALKAIREATHLSQRAFADSMGVPLRTYEDLEGGKTTVRPVHLNAARWALVQLLAGDDVGLVSTPDDLAEIIRNAAWHI
ncbi:helix-turn-helix transcriptional regulator [Shinella sp.]|uniref:helix-turn-helix domain-containing protein n=1 Tax=Shinella sp. TaxID=1870904 RepID=UPI00301CAF23